MKVKVYIEYPGGANRYDVRVLAPDATLQDYLDAMNEFIEKNTAVPCRGCDECCWERIPLTSIDVMTYIKMIGPQLGLEKSWPVLDFLKKYAYVYVEGQVVDISLGYTIEGACRFLNQGERICACYTARSLVCQSYVCMESSKRARELRSQLVNTGMDELVRLWLMLSQQKGINPYIHEGHNACPKSEDYPSNGFTGKKAYREVLLRDVCDATLWKQLTAHS